VSSKINLKVVYSTLCGTSFHELLQVLDDYSWDLLVSHVGPRGGPKLAQTKDQSQIYKIQRNMYTYKIFTRLRKKKKILVFYSPQ